MISADMLLAKFRGKRLLLDSNLLLVLLVGSFQREQITKFKRTENFSLQEFDLLVAVVRQFSILVTTPQILTEVSSLSNALPGYLKTQWFAFFASSIRQFIEVLTPANELCEQSCFNPYGLADASIQKASADTLVLTEDFRLAGYLATTGVATIDFRSLVNALRF